MTNRSELVERGRSALLVIDVQDYFLGKLPLDWRGPIVERMAWLMRVARALDIPILATAEDVARDGPLVAQLADLLGPDSPPPFDKHVFGLHDQADIRAAVDATGRDTFVIVGLETDVCVAHSALGLESAGHRAVVIEDACASPAPNHEYGIARLRAAGVTVTSCKGIYYEWVRDLATHAKTQRTLNVPAPPGMTL